MTVYNTVSVSSTSGKQYECKTASRNAHAIWERHRVFRNVPTFLIQLRPNDKILSFFIPAKGIIRSMQFVDSDNCLPCQTCGKGMVGSRVNILCQRKEESHSNTSHRDTYSTYREVGKDQPGGG